ncbi:MAG: hypothetical protein LRY40_07370 [Shewanella fodinae]|nr:hypothetical protein [Shewanella fodinae]
MMAGTVSGAVMLNDERPIGTQLDDTNTEFRISSVFSTDEELKSQCNISGISMNGNVLLIGQAPNSRLRDKAVHWCRI